MRFFYLLLCLLLLFARSCHGEEIWYLRIIARDDSPAAQAEKIALRDHILPLFPANARDMKKALPDIIRSAEFFAPCRVQIRKWAPHEKTPPAPTVYITLGKGGGRNWWGLLYRDACLFAQAEPGKEMQEHEPLRFSFPWLHRICALLGL